MKNNFFEINYDQFIKRFSSPDDCLSFLADMKWGDGYTCRHCGHTSYCKGKKPYSRRCNRCKKEESATAHTFFHHCRLPIVEAFKLVHKVCNNPQTSTYELSRMFHTRQMTCWKFKSKVTECISRNGTLVITDKS